MVKTSTSKISFKYHGSEYMCSNLLQTEDDIKNHLAATIHFGQSFDGIQLEASFLTVSHLNNLLKTFPPVWKCTLIGFVKEYKGDFEDLYMVVEHFKGKLSYFIGRVKLDYSSKNLCTFKEMP